MHRLSGQDFWAGLMFIGVAIGGLMLTQDLSVGTATDMGPGYVPRMLSYAIGVLGVIIVSRSLLRGSSRVDIKQYRPILLVSMAALAFALLLPAAGLVPAIVALVVLSSLAGRELSLTTVVGLSIALAVFCIVVFKIAIGLNLAVVRGVW